MRPQVEDMYRFVELNTPFSYEHFSSIFLKIAGSIFKKQIRTSGHNCTYTCVPTQILVMALRRTLLCVLFICDRWQACKKACYSPPALPGICDQHGPLEGHRQAAAGFVLGASAPGAK